VAFASHPPNGHGNGRGQAATIVPAIKRSPGISKVKKAGPRSAPKAQLKIVLSGNGR
jgi:hypothetical protein